MSAKNDRAKFTAISLFTGAGGLDIGIEAAGFEIRAAVEINAECVNTLHANRDWPIIQGCVHDIPSKKILHCADLIPGEVDLLFGGPPCQPFSKSGYWSNGDTRRLFDPGRLPLAHS